MAENRPANKPAKGEFEEFKSAWMLQVAADRGAKAAAPAAIVLACEYLNRGSGKAWPGINSLKERTGAASTNTIRSALKLLEERGHAHIEWSDGGKNKTHVVTPLVNGKPFRNLKGVEAAEPFNNLKGSHEANPSTFGTETLQVSDAKPFKKLNPNHLKEPLDIQGAAKAAPPEDRDNNSSGDALGLRRASPTGGEREQDYSFEDLLEIERRNAAFATGPLPEFDGQETPPIASPDDYLAGDEPFSADDPSSADHKTTATANADASDLQLLERCERQAYRLSEFDELLIAEMRQTLDAGRDLTVGQRRFLRNEILPLVCELERQPSPPEVVWDGETEKKSASGETNAPAT